MKAGEEKEFKATFPDTNYTYSTTATQQLYTNDLIAIEQDPASSDTPATTQQVQ